MYLVPSSSGVTDLTAEVLRGLISRNSDIAFEPGNVDNLDSLTRTAIQLLGRNAELPDGRALAEIVAAECPYTSPLLDPALLSPPESVQAANALSPHASRFVADLIHAADELRQTASIMRAIDIIDKLGRADVAAQWVRRLTTHKDANIRSRAVKILSCLHVNLNLIEKQLESSDPRIRANALEGLWGGNSPSHRRILEKAAGDPHHRVAANGLLGLFHAGAPGAAQRMSTSAQKGSALHRAAAAWAMGQTGSEQFIPELEKMLEDAEEGVRGAATRALANLRTTPPDDQP